MKPENQSVTHKLFLNTGWHANITSVLVGATMLVLYLWIAGGLILLVTRFYQALITMKWEHGAENMIKEVVILLAALELIRTLQSYLTLGRVKVTFILDAALVVLIGELISLWYKHFTYKEIFSSIGVISILIILRIVTTKFSPDNSEL